MRCSLQDYEYDDEEYAYSSEYGSESDYEEDVLVRNKASPRACPEARAYSTVCSYLPVSLPLPQMALPARKRKAPAKKKAPAQKGRAKSAGGKGKKRGGSSSNSKTGGSLSGPAASELNKLLARASRQDLERALFEQVDSGNAFTLEELTLRLDPDSAKPRVVVPYVEAAAQLGNCDGLTRELLLDVITYLPIRGEVWSSYLSTPLPDRVHPFQQFLTASSPGFPRVRPH